MTPMTHSLSIQRRIVLRLFFALLIVVLFFSCGNFLVLESVVDRLIEMDPYGGSLLRLYSTPYNDDFYDVLELDENIFVVGTVQRLVDPTDSGSGLQDDGLLLRIREDGSIAESLAFAEAYGSPSPEPYLERFVDIDVITDVGAGGDRLFVGGSRSGSGLGEGVVLQLNVSADAVQVERVSVIDAGGNGVAINAIAADGPGGIGVAAVGSSAGKALFARININTSDGTPESVSVYDPGSSSALRGVTPAVSLPGDYFVAAGEIETGVNLKDVLLMGIDASGNVVAAMQINFGFPGPDASEEYVTAIDSVLDSSGNESFVIVGATNAYFDGIYTYTVIVASWDGANDFVIEKALLVRPSDFTINMVAQAVLGLDGDNNYWGRDSLFVVAGDSNVVILMDTSGEVVWASAPSLDTLLQVGRSHGIAPNNQTSGGFYIAGENQEYPGLEASRDGSLAWALPSDGSSFPQTVPITSAMFVQDVTQDLSFPSVTMTPASSTGYGLTEYLAEDIADMTIVESPVP